MCLPESFGPFGCRRSVYCVRTAPFLARSCFWQWFISDIHFMSFQTVTGFDSSSKVSMMMLLLPPRFQSCKEGESVAQVYSPSSPSLDSYSFCAQQRQFDMFHFIFKDPFSILLETRTPTPFYVKFAYACWQFGILSSLHRLRSRHLINSALSILACVNAFASRWQKKKRGRREREGGKKRS